MGNTTNNTKVTKLDTVNKMLADDYIIADAGYKAYLENEKAILERRKANKKATKTQTENENIMTIILDTMINLGTKATITEIWNASSDLQPFSNQKLSALVKILVDRGLVTKSIEKGKSLFELVDSDNVNIVTDTE